MEDKYPKVNRRLAPPEVISTLSKRNLPRWLGAVAWEWAIIALVLWMCMVWPRWWVWAMGFIIIGLRQHALGVLGHEGAHYLVSQSRRWNDPLANYLTCYPLLFAVEGLRTSHLEHHWYLETSEDPSKVSVELFPNDWTFPMSRLRVFTVLLRDLSGVSQAASAALLKYLWDIPNKRRHLLKISIIHIAAFAGFWWAGHPMAYPILWIAPLFTVAVACYRVRATAEHSGFTDQGLRYQRTRIDSLTSTRTSILHPALAALFAPYNVSYHIEHHLFPAIPAFNLKKLHQELVGNPEYSANAHLTQGYLGLFRELTASERT